MKQYDSYKDSGTPWIGQIPSHWDRQRIKFLISQHSDGIWGDDEKGNYDDIACFRIADFDYEHMRLNNEKPTLRNIPLQQVQDRIIQRGDLLLEKSGGGEVSPVGRVVINNNDTIAVCSNFIHYLRIESNTNHIYICYYFKYLYSNKINLLYFNQTTGIQNLNIRDYLGQTIYLPKLAEQQQIVNYLDKKCSSIDKLIATQEKRIALLGELKQSIITEAVTRGLNPDAPLKDSGIDWIGKIPEHWEVRRLKYWLKSPLMYGANEAPDNSDLSDPRYIRITDIDDNGYLKDDTFCTLCLNTAEPYLLDKGDILFARSGATVGKTYIHRTEDKACFAGYLIKAKINKEVGDCEYLYLYTKTSIFSNWKDSINIQATIQNIGADKYANLFITYPPISEQIEIAEFLKCQVKPLDSAITKAKREVELLREYKQTIITEAVTGKIKVC